MAMRGRPRKVRPVEETLNEEYEQELNGEDSGADPLEVESPAVAPRAKASVMLIINPYNWEIEWRGQKFAPGVPTPRPEHWTDADLAWAFAHGMKADS